MAEQSLAEGLVTGRDCGTCSVCCKLLAIDYLDPPKPQGQWCTHCSPGKGCAIWQERPQGCITFNCDWRKNAQLGDEWRPDRAGFLLNRSSETSPFEVIVDVGRPDAWRREPYYSSLKRAAHVTVQQGQPIVVHVGTRRWVMLPDADVILPPEHHASGFRLLHDSSIPGGRWHVEFVPQPKAG